MCLVERPEATYVDAARDEDLLTGTTRIEPRRVAADPRAADDTLCCEDLSGALCDDFVEIGLAFVGGAAYARATPDSRSVTVDTHFMGLKQILAFCGRSCGT